MKYKLSDILSSLIGSRQTGQLAITVRGINHHCRINLRDGDIYQVVCGKQIDTDCLDILAKNDLLECFFIPGLNAGGAAKTALSKDQLFSRLKDRDVNVDMKSIPGTSLNSPHVQSRDGLTLASSRLTDLAQISEGIKAALMRQIGPVGTRIMTRVIEQKWGAPISTKEDIQTLIDLLKDEIDDEESRKDFISETRKYI